MLRVVKNVVVCYDVVRISGHAVSNVGVIDEWLIETYLEESGRDPRDFLWRRHLPERTTKKFSLEVGNCVPNETWLIKYGKIPIEFICVTNGIEIMFSNENFL
jgi:hypothetical protein